MSTPLNFLWAIGLLFRGPGVCSFPDADADNRSRGRGRGTVALIGAGNSPPAGRPVTCVETRAISSHSP